MVLNNDSHTTEHTQHIKERSCRKETVARSAGAAAFASTAQHKKNMFLLGGFTNCGGQYRCNDDVRVCRVRIRTRLSRQVKGKVTAQPEENCWVRAIVDIGASVIFYF